MNPIKPKIKTEIIPILTLVLTGFASFYFYLNFPERVPTHWNFAGEVDAYSSRAFGAFGIPLMLLAVYVFFLFLPMLDPNKDRYIQFIRPYQIFKNLIIGFLALIYFAASLNGIGKNIPINFVVPILVGFLFIILGNYMGKIKRNWFIGVRTPWTISSEEVWNKTNRFGGHLFILFGILMIFMPILPAKIRFLSFIAAIVALAFGTFIYSYVLFLKENKENKKDENNNQSTKY